MESIDRFINAQESSYSRALEEVRNGRKTSHWIWYIFPQLRGLGVSYRSELYGIQDMEEARLYWADPILKSRLEEITKAFLMLEDKSAFDVFGGIDSKKVQSCMTLFDMVSPGDIYEDVLNKYYEGRRCERTISMVMR